MYTLYYSPGTASMAVHWALIEMGVRFEAVSLDFDAGEQKAAAYRKLNPAGRVPTLVVDGQPYAESAALLMLLAERHPGVWPSDSKARAWARCAVAEMHSGFAALRSHCGMNCGLRIRLPDALPAVLHADIARIDELWSEGLVRFGGPFLAGNAFGAVDAFFAPVAFRIQTCGLSLGDAASAYAQRLCELPAMRRWYADALQETWRDPEHEEEAKQFGTLLEDLRTPAA